jgi:hypothetical protein
MSSTKDGPYSGAEYLDFLKAPANSGSSFVGLVKAGDDPDHLMFAHRSGCSRWVSIPVNQVESVHHLGWAACGDHQHALARVALKSPKKPEANTFAELASLHHDMTWAATSPAGATGALAGCVYDPVTGQWRC